MTLKSRQNLKKEQVISHFLSLNKEELELRFMRFMGKTQLECWWEEVINREMVFDVFCVEELGEDIVGFAQLSFHRDSTIGELAVSVSPQVRGKQLSRKLMTALIDKAKEVNLDEIVVLISYANQPMIKIIKEMGFKTKYVEGDLMGVLVL